MIDDKSNPYQQVLDILIQMKYMFDQHLLQVNTFRCYGQDSYINEYVIWGYSSGVKRTRAQ